MVGEMEIQFLVLHFAKENARTSSEREWHDIIKQEETRDNEGVNRSIMLCMLWRKRARNIEPWEKFSNAFKCLQPEVFSQLSFLWLDVHFVWKVAKWPKGFYFVEFEKVVMCNKSISFHFNVKEERLFFRASLILVIYKEGHYSFKWWWSTLCWNDIQMHIWISQLLAILSRKELVRNEGILKDRRIRKRESTLACYIEPQRQDHFFWEWCLCLCWKYAWVGEHEFHHDETHGDLLCRRSNIHAGKEWFSLSQYTICSMLSYMFTEGYVVGSLAFTCSSSLSRDFWMRGLFDFPAWLSAWLSAWFSAWLSPFFISSFTWLPSPFPLLRGWNTIEHFIRIMIRRREKRTRQNKSPFTTNASSASKEKRSIRRRYRMEKMLRMSRWEVAGENKEQIPMLELPTLEIPMLD